MIFVNRRLKKLRHRVRIRRCSERHMNCEFLEHVAGLD
jgi:hypothetical protein